MTAPRFTSDVLARSASGRWLGTPPAEVVGISTDTRALVPGALFVALKGERFDAHDFLADAARAGAAAAVVAEARAGDPSPLPRLAVRDPLAALGALAHVHRARFPIPVVGVTGSNGKTTTREMVAAILATRGPVLKTEGNLNNEVGVPLTLFGLGPEHQAAVIEMGMSNPGEIARLAAIALPQLGIVTLAAPAHLAGLGTVERIADAKAELYFGLPESGIAVVNADDPRMLERARRSGRRMVTFSGAQGRRGDVVVLEVVSQGADGLRFVLGIGNREVPVHIPGLVGAHNAQNAAAAAAAATVLGCTDREIVRGLAEVRPVGRRLRVEELPSGVRLLDDCYNANPTSMSAGLRSVVELAAGGGRPVAVLGDMLELGPEEESFHRALGEEAARVGVRALATFGPRSRFAAEAARAAGLEAFHTEDLPALATWARETLRSGDVLLVKGSRGMKLERLVEALRERARTTP
jgi:UDP-N-acetylmuramoyl-tripeptide--D-alanyl-D-alanine ligase